MSGLRKFIFNYPITRQQILDSSKLKEFADDNFIFDENGRKLSKQVENTGGKGEIGHYEQFLLFPLCFQKACFPGVSKGVIVWEWVIQPFPKQALVFTCLQYKSFENTVGKGEIARNNFSFSHSVFYPFRELSANFIKLKIVICKLFQFGRVENLSSGKGLNISVTCLSIMTFYIAYSIFFTHL